MPSTITSLAQLVASAEARVDALTKEVKRAKPLPARLQAAQASFEAAEWAARAAGDEVSAAREALAAATKKADEAAAKLAASKDELNAVNAAAAASEPSSAEARAQGLDSTMLALLKACQAALSSVPSSPLVAQALAGLK